MRDGWFLGAALMVNFVVVPLVVAVMFSFLPPDQAVRLDVLLVLLTPCVDFVIVFCGLASAFAVEHSVPPIPRNSPGHD